MANRALKRIALLLPHTDTTLETDLQISLPSDIIIHTARMWLDEVGEEAEKRMVDTALPNALRELEHITHFDGAIFGCTSASAVYGKDGLKRIHRQMEECLRCPANSAFGAVLDAAAKTGAKSIGLLTPYTHDVNIFFAKTLAQFGISCDVCYGLGISDDTKIACVEPERIMELASEHRETLNSQDLVLISCTNFRAAEIHNRVQNLLHTPVITSNQAIIDWILSIV